MLSFSVLLSNMNEPWKSQTTMRSVDSGHTNDTILHHGCSTNPESLVSGFRNSPILPAPNKIQHHQLYCSTPLLNHMRGDDGTTDLQSIAYLSLSRQS